MRRFWIATFLFLFLCPARASQAASLSIESNPDALSADQAGTVSVTLLLKDGEGRPLSGRRVFLTATRGSLSEIEDVGNGRYRALLSVPEQPAPRRPDFLLVAASALVGDEAPAAGLAIPVHANLVLQGNAAPGVTMRASAGGRTLGAATSGADGRFRLVAPVPPGFESVTIVAAKAGRSKTSTVSVDASNLTRHVVQPVPGKLSPGGAPGFVNVFAIQPSGRVEASDRFDILLSSGVRASALKLLGQGVFQSRVSLFETAGDEARVTVTYEGVERSALFETAEPGLARIDIRSDATETYPGQAIALTLSGYDFADLPAPGAVISIYADGAFSGEAAPRGAGEYAYTYEPLSGDTRREITFHAQGLLESYPEAEARSPDLRITIKEPDISLKAESSVQRLESGTAAVVRIRAESRENRQGVTGLRLEVGAETGSAGAVRDLDGGNYEFDYTAPAEYAGRSIAVVARVPDAPGAPQIQISFEWLGPGAPFGEARQIEVSASGASVPAGGSITITARLNDSTGRGVPGRTVSFSADAGIPGAVTDNRDGSYTTQLVMPDVAPSGAFAVRAACDCGGAGLSGQMSLTVPPKPASAISLSTDNDTVYLSGPVDAPLRISVTDSSGQGVAEQSVTITAAQAGTTQSQTVTTDSTGSAETAITLIPPSGAAEITASLSSNPSVSQSLTIQKVKYQVSRLELTAAPAGIPADSGSTMEIEAYAIDETGASAAGERIEVSLASGSGRLNATSCTTGDDGRCTVQYTSGPACGTVSIGAYAYSQDTVRQSVSGEETPAIPASLELNGAIPSTIVANGTDRWTMQILALDAGQCPVPGDTLDISVSANGGSVESTAATGADGAASADYTAGLVPGDVTILARSRTAPLVALSTELTLLPWQPSSYDVSVSTNTPTAGVPFTITVTARDFFGNVMTDWDVQDLAYSMSGPSNAPDGTPPSLPAAAAVLPAFNNGVAVFNTTLFNAETVALSFTDGKVTSQSSLLTVLGAAAVTFNASADAAQTAGAQFTLQITALDVYGNSATYNPAGKTFAFSGAASSPDGDAPSYPSSAAVIAAFSNASAALPVTLYKAETASLTISDGFISGTTGSITVARAQASQITVVQGNNQSQLITTALAQNPVVKVSDAYGNPVAGASVTFAVASGGGSATGLSKTTDASGRAGPDSWTMGGTIGANTMTATFTDGAGGAVTINASAYVPEPNAVISLESNTRYICPGDTVDLTGGSSTASAVSSISGYTWDFGGALGGASTTAANPGLLQYTATDTITVSLTVTDSFSQTDTDTYTIYVNHQPGPFSLNASPASITANGITTTTITSSTIYGCGQAPVDDGMIFTVASALGVITSADQSGLGGIQRVTSAGVIDFVVQSGTDTGTSVMVAQSVDFSTLTGYISVAFTGPDTIRPFVVSHSPEGGQITGIVPQITMVFSENVQLDNDDFRVRRDGNDVNGNWNYTSSNYTAVFTPNSPLNASGATIEVIAESTITDLAGNRLDGEQSGSNSDFVFSFGGDISSTPPVVASCISAPAVFSPDPSDGLPDSTHITIPVADDMYIKYWRVEILSGGSAFRTYVQYNTCSCDNTCEANTTACANCCTNAAAPPGCCTSASGDVEWDGTNSNGDFVANDVYDYEVTAFDLESNPSTVCTGQATVSNPIDFGGFGP